MVLQTLELLKRPEKNKGEEAVAHIVDRWPMIGFFLVMIFVVGISAFVCLVLFLSIVP